MGLRRLSALALLLAGCADAAELGAARSALRPDTRDGGLPQPTFEPGVAVEHLDSPSFRVHFARTGRNAVPTADLDLDGTPDAVETVASEYERVLAYYRDTLGFLPPRSDAELADENGGDGRFDVYLVDFPNSADGSFRAEGCNGTTCTGYMLQENDFDGRGYPNLLTATRILASHELFHAVQNAYRALPSIVMTEATAVWASESYDPSLPDFEGFIPAYLARAERSLLQEPLGPPDSFCYGAGLFFAMISETCQPAVMRAFWEELARTEDAWPAALDRVLARSCSLPLSEIFLRFARWNLQTGSRASNESYASAARYPEVSEQAITLPYEDDLLRTLPLSTHYFVAHASGPVAIWASSGEVLAMLAIEGADGKLRELASTPANQISSRVGNAGERVHASLVDTRIAGSTLRLALCLGSPSEVADCVERMGGVQDAGVEEPDAASPLDAGASDAARVDILRDAALSGSDGAVETDERAGDGCALATGTHGLDALALALLALRRRRR